MKIALIDPLEISAEELASFDQTLTGAGHEFVSYDTRTLDADEIVSRCEGAEVVIIANLPFKENVLTRLPALKMISVAFTGVDHVDVAFCEANNIAVSNAAGYSTISVAELAVGMAINVYREGVACDAATRNLEGRAGRAGLDLAGKTVGILGTGSIGQHAAKLFNAFGCDVIGWSRSERDEFKQHGRYVDKDAFFASADIVSLHTPLNAETIGIVGEPELKSMKSSAVLINCARGPVVDQAALAAALTNGEIAHAAIDVFDVEPPLPKDHPLLGVPNTTLAPHVAYATKEAFSRRAVIVFDNITSWLDGDQQNVICAAAAHV